MNRSANDPDSGKFSVYFEFGGKSKGGDVRFGGEVPEKNVSPGRPCRGRDERDAVVTGPGGVSRPRRPRLTRPRLTRSTFTPLLGSTFRVSGEGNDFDVVLKEINDLGPSSRTDTENQFSLLFQGPADRSVTQGTLTFSNARTGNISLFVVPIDRGVKALNLQSIINRK